MSFFGFRMELKNDLAFTHDLKNSEYQRDIQIFLNFKYNLFFIER
jgi:hypothetical protein